MNIIYYILFPVVVYVLDLILGGIIPIATLPFTWVIVKIQKQPRLFQFRIDMIIQGIIRGIVGVYLVGLLINLVEVNINLWWLFLTYIWLSYMSIRVWNKTNHFAYEFSLNISPIVGYVAGIVIFIDLFTKQ